MRIQTPLYGGNFTSDAAGPVAFVLPGELVEVTPAFRILEASQDRVDPGCVHFGACGGCHYQQASYPGQLELKRTILEDLLNAANLRPFPTIEVEFGAEWYYRNRIRLRIEPGTDTTFQAGYNLRGTNDFLPIRMCPIAAPLLWRAAEAILRLSKTDLLIRRWLAITSELELFATPDGSRLQLQFFIHTAEAGLRESHSFTGLCERIAATLPALAGAGATLDPELNRRARRRWRGAAWGAAGLKYPAAGRTYWLPRGAFFQVNRFLIDRLVSLVTAGRSGELAWDLYAGVGLFTRALAASFTHVVAVEGAEAAISSLKAISLQAVMRLEQGSIEPVHSATLDFLRDRELQRERPSLIVLDPPRAGLGSEAAAILSRIAAPEIVYVSCDPTTLARDLEILGAAYSLIAIYLVDLFPQTFHLEAVVHLRKI